MLAGLYSSAYWLDGSCDLSRKTIGNDPLSGVQRSASCRRRVCRKCAERKSRWSCGRAWLRTEVIVAQPRTTWNEGDLRAKHPRFKKKLPSLIQAPRRCLFSKHEIIEGKTQRNNMSRVRVLGLCAYPFVESCSYLVDFFFTFIVFFWAKDLFRFCIAIRMHKQYIINMHLTTCFYVSSYYDSTSNTSHPC